MDCTWLQALIGAQAHEKDGSSIVDPADLHDRPAPSDSMTLASPFVPVIL